MRQQFGSAANIRLARHSIRFYERFDTSMRVPAHRPHAWFRQRGYLFLVDAARAERFERRFARQRELGARVERLDVDAIRALVPDLFLDDIRFGVFGPDDGYANPREVLAGFRHAAAAAGAAYVTGEVARVDSANGRVRGVTLDDGRTLEARAVVNAAGPFAATLAARAGVDLPVTPVRQHLFRCALPGRWPHRFPVVVDPGGVHWRHDDPVAPGDPDRIVVACTNPDEPPGENFECDPTRWAEVFRPPLVTRLPALAAAKLEEGWAGLYEMTPDHNPLLGEHPDLAGFVLANGFSGARPDDGPGHRRGAGGAADDRRVDDARHPAVRPRPLRARGDLPRRGDDLTAAREATTAENDDMDLDAWYDHARREAAGRGLPGLEPLLETLRGATRRLRAADWARDPEDEPAGRAPDEPPPPAAPGRSR